MLRTSRFAPPTFQSEIRAKRGRALPTLRLFDSYRLLPANWMFALVDPDGSYDGYGKLLTRMKNAGLLGRKTFDGSKNTSETMTYWRTDLGDSFLRARNFEALPHDGTHDAHQVLTDLLDANIELGARKHALDYHKWDDIREHPATPPLPAEPFRFKVGHNPKTKKDLFLVPDGRPFYIKAGRNSILFLKELDRDNEKAPEIIRNKLRNYMQSTPEIKGRYGFDSFMLLFVTTNEIRKRNIEKWVREVVGPNRWILTHLIEDHIKLFKSTAPVTTHLIDTPFDRVGAPRFSLKTLTDV